MVVHHDQGGEKKRKKEKILVIRLFPSNLKSVQYANITLDVRKYSSVNVVATSTLSTFPWCQSALLTLVNKPNQWETLTQGNRFHSHAEGVETSVTLITEHHFLLVMGLLTHCASLTLHTLPGVGLY